MSTTGKPRILFVLRYHVITSMGGAEVKAWTLSTELAKRGWDVHYASEMNRVPDPNPLDGVTLHGLPENPSYWTGNRLPLRKLMRELNPDVVFNRVFDIYTCHAMEEAPPQAVTVWSVSSDPEGSVASSMAIFWRTNSLATFLRRWPVHFWWAWAARRGARRAKLVIAQHHMQQELLRRRGFESVILSGWKESVPDSAVQSHNGNPMVLWVGSLKKLKQPQLFIELARRLQDTPATFVIAGEPQQPGFREMVAQAERELSNFRYAGLVPPAQVNELFSQAHVHAKTSVFEGLPDTFIQAWLRGVPVISLNIDPDHLLRDKGLGICVHNIDEFERELRLLLADPERRRAIGRRARAYAVPEYDLDANIKKFEGLLAARGVRLPNR